MVAMVGGIVGFCGEEVVVTQGAQAQWVGFSISGQVRLGIEKNVGYLVM